jgi:hypothetical protein
MRLDQRKTVPLEVAEARMRPGQFSQSGFLGADESLRELLAGDDLTLKQLGVSARELSRSLGSLLAAAIESTPPVTAAGPYAVRLQHYKGRQACPFSLNPHENNCVGMSDARFAAIDWTVTNPRNGMQLSGPGLIVHLIAEHGFFEGFGSTYRVSPAKLAELLEVPGTDYVTKK